LMGLTDPRFDGERSVNGGSLGRSRGRGDGWAKSSNELEARVVSIPINITTSARNGRL